ncbi:hypothetical protein H310_11352 [Aphanomyces invadans]|uniref:AMP-dependent synthetase/ligase domain-containing protein n=1 Tax=Aphanomyces invadans TaxID=157072 RepID=A0A024TM37_9STRA|nr:hypothetical protein H310_11352 [Aphanomyces invadans]ETV95054.1 hypothetical protein H310_11352 [Aphanomyces invadans]|eukprot:XP_008876227.1 hypothetical protein H310_11352 [Aphanomyces invadans]
MLAALLTTPFALAAAGLLGFLGYLYTLPSHKLIGMPANYVAVDESEVKPGHGPIHRVGTCPRPFAPTMLHALQSTVKKFGSNPFLGHRPFDSDGVALDYVWESYDDVYKRIQNFAAGLRHEKMMEPTNDSEKPLCLYMKNRPEWVIGQYTAMYLGGFAVALYDTLGADSTQFILKHTQSPTVVCTTAELAGVFNAKATVPTLKFVVVVDVDTISTDHAGAATAAGLKIVTLGEVEAIGAMYPIEPATPGPNDIYCLIYTSGTTGDPKGVPITHLNVLTADEGMRERICSGPTSLSFSDAGVHLSYLPLAHCIEHIIHSVIIMGGGRIGFYQGNTLKLTEDLCVLRPTLFVTVPRLLNKIYDKVVNGAQAAGGLKTWLFNLALDTKLSNLKQFGESRHAVFDKLIFSKVQTKIGLDRCEFLVTGSAPLADDVMNFFRILFDFPVHEGYGQSETVTAGTMTHVKDTACGTIGVPLTPMQIKLVSIPEMGYNVTDTTHGDDDATRMPVNGRGEICFRGPPVFSGYYKDPARTAEAFDADGWLHSGDIGVWTLDGRLKIVDRKKNIFKLSQGEYVAPEKIENILVTSPYVAQPFVYGDSLHSVVVAIVVPEEAALQTLATSLGITGSFEQVCANDKVVDEVLTSLAALSKKSKLYGFETIKALKLIPTPFSVENDLMTPTFKLKRNEAKKAFLHDIDDLYAKCGDLVAGHNVLQK